MSLYNVKTPWLQPEAYYSLSLQRYAMAAHSHPRCEIMYVLSGRSTVEADGKRHELSHGQYIFLDEGVPHRLSIDDPRGCSIMNIEFACRAEGGAACVRGALAACPAVQAFFRAGKPYFVADGRESFGSVMKDLVARLERESTPDTRFLIGNLLERTVCELAEASARERTGGSLVYVRRAAAFLEAHCAGPVTVEDAARAAGVNRSYLQSLFRREFGCGVMAYVSRLRINRAKFLLTNTSMRQIDIAEEVGFNSRQNFALAFTKAVGVAPSVFRRQTSSGFSVETDDFKRVP